MNPSRIERIRELFKKLKQGYDWCQRNQDNQAGIQELFARSEPFFKELADLGVSRIFSEALFIFGPLVTEELVKQFDKKNERREGKDFETKTVPSPNDFGKNG